jgi:hypothetical protein
MTDARDYLSRIAGIHMPKITVLVGRPGRGRSRSPGARSRPCLGRVPSVLGLGADLIGALGSLVNPTFLAATTAVEFVYSVDMILRPSDDDSRGVPVHE